MDSTAVTGAAQQRQIVESLEDWKFIGRLVACFDIVFSGIILLITLVELFVLGQSDGDGPQNRRDMLMITYMVWGLVQGIVQLMAGFILYIATDADRELEGSLRFSYVWIVTTLVFLAYWSAIVYGVFITLFASGFAQAIPPIRAAIFIAGCMFTIKVRVKVQARELQVASQRQSQAHSENVGVPFTLTT